MTSNRYHNYYQDGAVCFWTSSVTGRTAVLRSPTAARDVMRIWDECRERCNVRIVGYVIMPDHIHLAVWAERARSVQRFLEQSLSSTSSCIVAMTDRAATRGNAVAKRWVARFRSRARDGAAVRVWKERGHAFPVTEPDTLLQKLEYMHNNLVRARLVDQPEDWEFSSASWYAGKGGPLRIDEIDW